MCMKESSFELITADNAVAVLNGPTPPATLRIEGVLFHYRASERRWFGANGVVIGWGRLDDLIDDALVPVYHLKES